MKSNKQCMKDILKYVTENTKVSVDGDNKYINLICTDIEDIVVALLQNTNYKKEEIIYNILKCNKYQLIDTNIPVRGNPI